MSVLLLIILLISIIISAMFGSAPLALEDVMEVIKTGLFYRDLDIAENMLTTFDIVWLLRLPRIILAICIGAGLSVCGVVIQAIVQNPLADPYILGVSSGASLGATTAIMLGLGVLLGENAIGSAAFIGAFIASVLVLVLSNIGGKANSVKLVLAGTALNAVFSAFSSFIIFFAADNQQAVIRHVTDNRRQLLHFLGIRIILRICSAVCFGRLCCPQLFVLQENQRFAAEEGIAVDGRLQAGQIGVLVKDRYFAVSLRCIAKNIFRQRGNNTVAVVILLAAQKQYLRLRQRLMLL